MAIPGFSVTPADCGIFTYHIVLFEIIGTSRVEVASYDPDTMTKKSIESPYITLNSIAQL